MNSQLAYGSMPIRGQELAATPGEYRAYKEKPKYNNVKKACEAFYKEVTEEGTYPNLMKSIRQGLSLEDIVKLVLIMKISKGDVAIIQFPVLVEPYMIILWYVSRLAGVEPVIYDTQNSTLTEEEINLFMTGGKS